MALTSKHNELRESSCHDTVSMISSAHLTGAPSHDVPEEASSSSSDHPKHMMKMIVATRSSGSAIMSVCTQIVSRSASAATAMITVLVLSSFAVEGFVPPRQPNAPVRRGGAVKSWRRGCFLEEVNCAPAIPLQLQVLSAKGSVDDDEYDRFIDSDANDNDDDDDDFDSPPILPFLLDDADPLLQTAADGSLESASAAAGAAASSSSSSSSAKLSRTQVESLTVPELKQQLRLRNMKVSGKKADLVDRLLGLEGKASMSIGMEQSMGADSGKGPEMRRKNRASSASSTSSSSPSSKGTPVDVSAYLDEEDKGKAFKSSDGSSSAAGASKSDSDQNQQQKEGEESDSPSSSSPYATEVWGEEARIVDDYEGRSIVVDSLSRTVIEYKGYNRTKAEAYVTAHRTALKAFIAGGSGNSTGGDNRDALGETPEEKVARIQRKREEESRITPKDFADIDAPNTGDEAGHYAEILERDYGDWGVYSPTGAQISAQEVQGVLLLSDVRGCFHDDTQALADKIAFECQPVVVMAPDLFRGLPWEEDADSNKGPGHNSRGEDYEQWRSNHPDERVNADIRAAAATLRKQYGVSSIAVFGTCYGGGRALEAAAGWTPGGAMGTTSATDASDSPPAVDPAACIAWYPTRYNTAELFGPDRLQTSEDNGTTDGEPSLAVMAVFAGLDTIPGATPEDADALKSALDKDGRIKDRMVKVFPGQEHGFAHVGLSRPDDEESNNRDNFLDEEFGSGAMQPSLARDNGDAEVASLLSTAWMETYTRAFLPTTGVAVMNDADSRGWSEELEMPDLTEANKRDIRQELEEAVKSHKVIPPDLSRMPSYQYGNEVFESEGGLEETLPEAETPAKPDLDVKLNEVNEDLSRIGFSDEDDDEAYFAKIKDAYDEGKLQSWLGNIPSDVGQMPEVPKSGAGFDDEFGLKVLDAMSELDDIGLSKDDDMGTTIQKFKSAMADGKLKRIQELRKERAALQGKIEANQEERRAAAKVRLKSIGVEEGDDHDTMYKKMKQAIDRGDFDNIATAIAVGDSGGGEDWRDDDEGPW